MNCKHSGKKCLTAKEAKELFDKYEDINSTYLCEYCGTFHLSSMSKTLYKKTKYNKPKEIKGVPEEHIKNRINKLQNRIGAIR